MDRGTLEVIAETSREVRRMYQRGRKPPRTPSVVRAKTSFSQEKGPRKSSYLLAWGVQGVLSAH